MTLVSLLNEAVARGASDIHLVTGAPVCFRIAGELVPVGDLLTAADILDCLEEVLTPERQDLLQKRRHISVMQRVEQLGSCRVSVFSSRGEPGAAIRVIAPELPPLDQLGLPKQLEEWCRRANGLVLVTGQTGAGKTTTLNSMIALVNATQRAKIVTIEDPIEFIHRPQRSLVVQKEISLDSPSSAEALVASLREDPDVIVIGEMRDLDTIATALTAAETGHLVLGTLHTRTASSTVERILDVFPANQQPQIRTQLAAALVAVISQLLLPRADGKGLVLAYETLITTDAVRAKIRDGNTKGLPDEITTGGKHEMRSMDESLRLLYESARITYDVAVANAADRDYLLRTVNRREERRPSEF